MSDLHLEFGGDFEWKPDPSATLVLAGDVTSWKQLPALLTQLGDMFRYVVMVLGNHEYYGHWVAPVVDQLPPNVFVLDNSVVVLDGIRFVGTTLWSHVEPPQIPNARFVADFRNVRSSPTTPFTVDDYNAHHAASVAFLEQQLAKNFSPTVVVTHHLPSYKLLSPRHSNPATDCFFATSLDKLFEFEPELWICGHSHSCCDTVINSTRVVKNCRGVTGYDLDPDFYNFSVCVGE